ncbi:MAG: cytochrome c peroxidase [Campylobacterota bacterium]|nr:cytochrome c peroxidase [Campylobacterota bacterium]
MKPYLPLLLASTLLFAIDSDELRQKAFAKGLLSMPTDYEKLKAVVDDPENPMTPEKHRLGKDLFFDKDLSKSRKIACAKCHDLELGGEDGLPTAIGHNKLPNPHHLNSPTVLNTAFSKHLFWDGRSPTLRDQAKGPTQAPFEMASTPELVEERVKEKPKYVEQFKAIYGGDNPVTFDNITKAIAVYEKSLITRDKFDAFLEGDDDAMSDQAKRGLELFIDIGCKGCHFGHGVGGQKMQKFPLRDYNALIDLTMVYNEKTKKREFKSLKLNFKPYHPYPIENRGGFMGRDGTQYFRVPILRNITQTGPYFHNGVVKELDDAIFLMGRNQLGLDLTQDQIDAITAFFKSMEGDLIEYDIR